MNDDTWSEVKLAWAKGETIQYFGYATKRWNDWTHKDRLEKAAASEWRVKPEPVRIRLHYTPSHGAKAITWYPGEVEPSGFDWVGPWQEVPECATLTRKLNTECLHDYQIQTL